MYIGLNIGKYDSALSFLKIENKKIIHLEHLISERFSQQKHLGNFPLSPAKHLKKRNDVDIKNAKVAINSFYIHPKRIESKYTEDLKIVLDALGLNSLTFAGNPDAQFISHHLCHAYSLLYQYPYDESLIIVADGGGNKFSDFEEPTERASDFHAQDPEDFEVVSVYHQKGHTLTLVKKVWAPLDRKFSVITGLGSKFEFGSKKIFGNWVYAGKIMGLSSYGHSEIFKTLGELDKSFPFESRSDFSKDNFDHLSKDHFEFYSNFASSIQKDYELQLETLLLSLKAEFSHIENISIAGGCALNCLANGKMIKKKIFKNIHVPAYPSDMGISLGACLGRAYQEDQIEFSSTPIEMSSAYMGSIENTPEKNMTAIEKLFENYKMNRVNDIHEKVAKLLAKGEVVAWFQGRSEPGERALGNRSILAVPSLRGMKNHLNDKIKFRENFRPYGCSLLQEDVSQYFETDKDFHSPYMAFALTVNPHFHSVFNEVMHIDGTSRLQTVTEGQNKIYYELLKSLKKENGHGVVLNTSLNIMGKPILETVQDAYDFFKDSEIKYIAIGDFLIEK